MLKKLFALYFVFTSTLLAQDEIDIEKRRNREQEFNSLIKVQIFNENKNFEKSPSETLFVDVKELNLNGNTLFPNFQMEAFLSGYRNENVNIYELINNLENKYIEKGYVTTRVGLDMEKSDLRNGNISLFVLEGKIDKVFYNDKENKLKTFLTFPQRINNELNVNDLDQGWIIHRTYEYKIRQCSWRRIYFQYKD